MPGPVVRRAGEDDAAALAMIGAATFLETYAHMIGLPDMLLHVAGKNSADYYRAWTGDTGCALWIAEMPATRAPVGYAVLTPPDLPIDTDGDDIELRRIYLLSKWKGGGLGGRLANEAIAHARQLGKRRLLIGVYAGNDGAIAFYRRLGCEQVGTRSFQVGEAVFNDLIFGMDV